MEQFEYLYTDFGKNLDKNRPLPEYPRPQMERDSYFNLNGAWEYAILSNCEILREYQGLILVPFSPESLLSGVMRQVTPDDVLYYRKTFTLPEGFVKDRVLLHFGAVDYEAEIFVNGKPAGSHKGGYFPFCLDITELLVDGENELTLTVTDPTDEGVQSRGKQKLKRGGIFYTPQSGIWQTVWMESVPANYIKSLRITPDIDNDCLSVAADCEGDAEGTVSAFDNGKLIASAKLSGGLATLKLKDYTLWTPENPKLYDLTVTVGSDTVKSYFGMRKFSTGKDARGKSRLMLNNRPYFHNGLLDQGYYSDGLYTPPSDEAMIFDIMTAKKAGFNMLRKHIKIEPLRWYYHCDRLGMLVWQDMVNGGGKAIRPLSAAAGFLNITLSDSNYSLMDREDEGGREEYYVDTRRTVETLYNSVSLCLWTPFNESWGQFDALRACDFVRALDPTRPIDHASGWIDQGGGDCLSLHIYFTPLYIPYHRRKGRVVVLSEFGGYSLKVDGHVFNKVKSFGYRKYDTKEKLTAAYEKLYTKQLLPLIKKGLSAAVYTQITDVEDEINGLLTYDRKVLKIDEAKLKEINDKLYGEFERSVNGK